MGSYVPNTPEERQVPASMYLDRPLAHAGP